MFNETLAAAISRDILDGPGFYVLPDMITSAQRTTVKREINRLRSGSHSGYFPDKENRERFFGLIYQSQTFQDVALGPIEIVKKVLGTNKVSLSGFSAHVVKPGTGSIGMHVDYPYGDISEPFPRLPVLGLQLIWAVDEFTKSNGATVFCPGTQLLCRKPDRNLNTKPPITHVTAPAGSLILAHCMCWHDSGENTSDGDRIGLLGNYTPSYIRPIEFPYFELKMPPTNLCPQMSELVGLSFYDEAVNKIEAKDRATTLWRKKRKG